MSFTVSEHMMQTALDDCPHRCGLFFWGTHVAVYADTPEVIDTLVCVYAHFVVDVSSMPDIFCCIRRRSSLARAPVIMVNRLVYELPDTERYVGYAELILFRYLLEQLADYAVLHAAVVTRDAKAVVLYGQSGFGKTTLALELLQRGYGFMSDEFCPVRLSDFLIEPFYRLVGLKRTSPFYGFTQDRRSVFLPSEGKFFFDCTDFFPSCPSDPCRASAFIEITGSVDTDICPPGGVVLEICMYHGSSDAVPDALQHLSGVTLSDPFQKGLYKAYRVTAVDRATFMQSFNTIWQENARDIFSVFPYRGEIPTYDRTPFLRLLPSFDAVTSIFSNIINRAPTGRLLASHNGSTASLTLLIGRLLHRTPCYSLHPGHLAKMADLIDNLKLSPG